MHRARAAVHTPAPGIAHYLGSARATWLGSSRPQTWRQGFLRSQGGRWAFGVATTVWCRDLFFFNWIETRSRLGLANLRSRPEMDVTTWLDWPQKVWRHDQGFGSQQGRFCGEIGGWSRHRFEVATWSGLLGVATWF